MNPIETAIATQREGAIAQSVARMSDLIDRELAKLNAAGGSLRELYARPRATDGAAKYKEQQARRSFIQAITAPLEVIATYDGPELRARDEKKIQAMRDLAAKDAAAAFDAYVSKLTGKVGAGVVSAECVGNLWQESRLTVTRDNGAVEVWKTQMIINFSALGKVFNQWPTRQIKNKKAA